MARRMIAGECYRAIVNCKCQTQRSVNSIHLLVASTTGLGATDDELAAHLDLIWGVGVRAQISASAEYTGCSAQRIFPLPVTVASFNATNNGPGLGGASLLPKQTAGLISFATALAGRPFRGRFYMPFPSVADDTGSGDCSVPYVADLVSNKNNFIQAILVGTLPDQAGLIPVIWHRANTKAGLPLKDTGTPITSGTAATGWATQRRRGFFGRPNP
jgi:hypothetical protein